MKKSLLSFTKVWTNYDFKVFQCLTEHLNRNCNNWKLWESSVANLVNCLNWNFYWKFWNLKIHFSFFADRPKILLLLRFWVRFEKLIFKQISSITKFQLPNKIATFYRLILNWTEPELKLNNVVTNLQKEIQSLKDL